MKTGTRIHVPSFFRNGVVIGHARLRIKLPLPVAVERLDIVLLEGNKGQIGEPQTLLAARPDGSFASLGGGYDDLTFRNTPGDTLFHWDDPVLAARRLLENAGYRVTKG